MLDGLDIRHRMLDSFLEIQVSNAGQMPNYCRIDEEYWTIRRWNDQDK